MAELGKVLNALENCTAHPKCRDCGWKECEYEHETVEIPLTLAKDAHSLLKAQEPKSPRFTVAYDKIFYACDNCGKSLVVMANCAGLVLQKYLPKYCSECGQAVKWDEPPKEG